MLCSLVWLEWKSLNTQTDTNNINSSSMYCCWEPRSATIHRVAPLSYLTDWNVFTGKSNGDSFDKNQKYHPFSFFRLKLSMGDMLSEISLQFQHSSPRFASFCAPLSMNPGPRVQQSTRNHLSAISKSCVSPISYTYPYKTRISAYRRLFFSKASRTRFKHFHLAEQW